ncbi:MAG TPA: hypothetical protein VM432_11875 [Bdellovibrionales bacterium]|nr:hypothetical protein [Bdellovibrionales bacterium]
MKLSHFQVFMMAAVLVASSKSFAAASVDCEGNEELYICTSLPEGAPESTNLPQAPVQEPMKASLVSEAELSGEAADYTVLAGQPYPGTYDGTIITFEPNRAMLAAEMANDKVKQVEDYLHSGVQQGDGLVSISDDSKK